MSNATVYCPECDGLVTVPVVVTKFNDSTLRVNFDARLVDHVCQNAYPKGRVKK